jgi:hypothetical protein
VKSPAGACAPLYNLALGDALSNVGELECLEDFP